MELISCGESRFIKGCAEHKHNCFEIVITTYGSGTTIVRLFTLTLQQLGVFGYVYSAHRYAAAKRTCHI